MIDTETDSKNVGRVRPEQKVEKQHVYCLLYLFTHSRIYPARAHEYTRGIFCGP